MDGKTALKSIKMRMRNIMKNILWINNADVVHAGAVNTLGAERQLVGLTFCHADDVAIVRNAQRVRESLEPNKHGADSRGWVEGGSVQTLQW